MISSQNWNFGNAENFDVSLTNAGHVSIRRCLFASNRYNYLERINESQKQQQPSPESVFRMAAPPPAPEPFDPTLQEELDGISFSWNTWPTTRIEASRTVVPIGAIYAPLKSRPVDLPPVEYPPVVCRCKAILNPFCGIDIASKTWTCQVYILPRC